MTYMYDMPDEIQVEADGPLRIITLNRPGFGTDDFRATITQLTKEKKS
jgi:hypothetical protein